MNITTQLMNSRCMSEKRTQSVFLCFTAKLDLLRRWQPRHCATWTHTLAHAESGFFFSGASAHTPHGLFTKLHWRTPLHFACASCVSLIDSDSFLENRLSFIATAVWQQWLIQPRVKLEWMKRCTYFIRSLIDTPWSFTETMAPAGK